MMTGETDLQALLRSMSPELIPDTYVFATVENSFDTASLHPRMTFREAEGTTLILLKEDADLHGIAYEFPCRIITLNIHSSLAAVGFLAAITGKLAALNMGVNPVAGFYHDHLFVPADRANDAMQALAELAAG